MDLVLHLLGHDLGLVGDLLLDRFQDGGHLLADQGGEFLKDAGIRNGSLDDFGEFDLEHPGPDPVLDPGRDFREGCRLYVEGLGSGLEEDVDDPVFGMAALNPGDLHENFGRLHGPDGGQPVRLVLPLPLPHVGEDLAFDGDLGLFGFFPALADIGGERGDYGVNSLRFRLDRGLDLSLLRLDLF